MSKNHGIILNLVAMLAAAAPLRAQTGAAPSAAQLTTGARVPSASVLVNGRKVLFKSLLAGNRNLVLFYPAACASCDSALQTLDKNAIQTLDAMGVAVFAVSPDLPAVQAKTAQRLALPYAVFSDPGGAAAQTFHVPSQPEALLIDNDGTLRAILGPGQTPLSGANAIAAAKALKRRTRAR